MHNTFRSKQNLKLEFGIALAKANNFDERDPLKHAEMGVGTDPEYIREMVDDIWNAYEMSDEEYMRERELRIFVS